jgi:hypothetical protein
MNQPGELPKRNEYLRVMADINSDMYHWGHASYALESRFTHLARLEPVTTREAVLSAHVLSGLIVPPDLHGFNSEDRNEAVAASYLGVATGLLVASGIHGRHFPLGAALSYGLSVDADDSAGKYEYDQSITLGLLEQGDIGLELVGETGRNMLRRWMSELVQNDFSHDERLFMASFGTGIIGPRNFVGIMAERRQKAADAFTDDTL